MSQKWFQSKCVRGTFILLQLISISSWIEAAPPKRLPQLLQEVEKKYTKAATLKADFSQSNNNPSFSQKKISSGKIFIKRPSKIRWETEKPDPSLLLGNGKKYWYYTPPFDAEESGQVIEKPASEVQSKLANALLSGEFSVAQSMSIQQKTPSVFTLVPQSGTAGTVSKATIEINLKTKVIQKVILDHNGGNHSEISLSHIILGDPLDDDLFIFHAPPNTETMYVDQSISGK